MVSGGLARAPQAVSLAPVRESGFYSPYFIIPKKGGGLRPILDLLVLNRALHKLLYFCTCLGWPVTLEPARCQSRLLRHSPLRTGYVRLVASQFSSPRRTLLKFLPHPQQSGVAERQTLGPALVSCPRSALVLGWVPVCSDSPFGDPTCVFFHSMAPLTVSPCLSLAETFCPLCCVAISPQAG